MEWQYKPVAWKHVGYSCTCTVANWEYVFSCSFGNYSPASHCNGVPIPTSTHPAELAAPTPPMGTKQQCCSPNWEAASPTSGDGQARVTSEELSHQRQTNGKPLSKLLNVSHPEAFAKDSDLVQMTRQAYFRTHHPKFDCKVPHNPLSYIPGNGQFCWPSQLRCP